ncbi:hypothetical protein BU14_0218s0050 [Porphyra umbilicalis]|uniref:Uncharacterized protein n=1 Tax=Porphyra umbilicalis TaxID=2786 RepID=A0A1X6P4W3_PORUM|nr:hypothetical protein BU14_0218s0050 [Porphyra umbilicalis]|eukprot:OSX75884.1 hypothetical protein BU14_0218s0050 [Porphyra umbilicalis]
MVARTRKREIPHHPVIVVHRGRGCLACCWQCHRGQLHERDHLLPKVSHPPPLSAPAHADILSSPTTSGFGAGSGGDGS